VARATAYLFKVPEGGAKGVDPGFHRQMTELECALDTTMNYDNSFLSMLEKGVAAGVITKEQAESLQAMI
jgi:hypothetical protein